MGQNILAIDIGTQSARAMVFDADGKLIDKARFEYAPAYLSPEPGWAEQDPDEYWRATVASCRKLWSQGVVRPDSIAAVSMTFQRATVVDVDASGKPLRPSILWLDQRMATHPPRLPLHWIAAFTAAGARDIVAQFQAEAESNWVAQNQPDIWRKTAKHLLLSGYITYRMSGEYRDSTACQVGYIPFDFKALRWCSDGDWKWGALSTRRAQMPDLVEPGHILGEVAAHAAEEIGIAKGTPIISGGSDKSCEVLGSGCTDSHQSCIGYGTTATLNVDHGEYVEPIRLVPPYASAQPGRYNLEYQVFRGFWMVTWFKEQFAHLEREKASAEGVAPEELLERGAAQVPPGSMGLILQPYWTPGVRRPGIEAKGAIIGFGAAHHKVHMYRAILEGLAYELRSGRERIEKRTGTAITELTICGGGSRSDLAMQIAADVFRLPARRPSYDEAGGLGAAVLGAVGAGLHRDLRSAVMGMTRTGRVFEPISANVRLYNDLYTQVYSPMYERLQPLYAAIMKITGYPKGF